MHSHTHKRTHARTHTQTHLHMHVHGYVVIENKYPDAPRRVGNDETRIVFRRLCAAAVSVILLTNEESARPSRLGRADTGRSAFRVLCIESDLL